jgi:LL-diaminopimelate aminotransferase
VLSDLSAQGLDASNIKALIINYPSNPIGATAPFSFYEEAVTFCRKHGIALISDVAYSEMYFAGEEAPHSILEVPGAKELAIEFHSLSKPYAMTGWRIGFAVGNAQLVELLANVKSTADSGIFKALQKTAAFALNSPECDQYIQDVNKIYEENQALTLKGFEKLGWPITELNPPRATFYLWLPIPPRYTSCEQFTKELLETSGIVAVPGTAFGPSGEGFIRLSLVLPKEQLEEVTNRMETDGFRYH